MTPGELGKIRAAVAEAAAALLARESNEETTAEALADELADSMIDAMISTYEEIQAKSYNLVVVASFKLPDSGVHTAAVGPLSTRAKQRARDLGERFAWDYKSRTGSGKYTLVPLIRNPGEAWDEARAHEVKGIAALNQLSRSALSLDPFGPACVCGLKEDLICPRHPEGRER